MQKLLNEGSAELTQGAFFMATQNEDLAILKLLVEEETQTKKDGNMEFGPLNENDWKEALFGPNNVSLKNIQNLKLIKYLKQLHEDENVEHPSGRTRVIF